MNALVKLRISSGSDLSPFRSLSLRQTPANQNFCSLSIPPARHPHSAAIIAHITITRCLHGAIVAAIGRATDRLDDRLV